MRKAPTRTKAADHMIELWETFNPGTYLTHCRAAMHYMPPSIREEFSALLALDSACSLPAQHGHRFDSLLLTYHRLVTPQDLARQKAVEASNREGVAFAKARSHLKAAQDRGRAVLKPPPRSLGKAGRR